MKLLPMTLGSVAAFALIKERRRRQAAERVAAAVLETLLRAIDANDTATGSHVRRVARYALILADAAGLDSRTRHGVERIALFHDVGKIHEALFDIIHDPQHLTPEEREAVRTHPLRGAEVLAPLAAFYPDLADGVLSHHERWDGSGYPRGLRGAEIPVGARIVAIADAFDAMTYGRRYQAAQSARDAAETLRSGRGRQFDPRLIDVFLAPPTFRAVIAALGEDSPPHPRRAPKLGSRNPPGDRQAVEKLEFRWRTTTTFAADERDERPGAGA